MMSVIVHELQRCDMRKIQQMTSALPLQSINQTIL